MSMTIDEMIAVLQAAKRGEQIQCFDKDHPEQGWRDLVAANWDFYRADFRVKPKPRKWWAALYPQVGLRGGLWETKDEAIRDSENREIIRVREVLEGEQ